MPSLGFDQNKFFRSLSVYLTCICLFLCVVHILCQWIIYSRINGYLTGRERRELIWTLQSRLGDLRGEIRQTLFIIRKIMVAIYAIIFGGGMLAGFASLAAGVHISSKNFVRKFFPKAGLPLAYVPSFSFFPYVKQVLQVYISLGLGFQLVAFYVVACIPFHSSMKVALSNIWLVFGLIAFGSTNGQRMLFYGGMACISIGVGVGLQVIPSIISDFAQSNSRATMRITFSISYFFGLLYCNLYSLKASHYPPVVGYVVPFAIYGCGSLYFLAIERRIFYRGASLRYFKRHWRLLICSASIQLFLQITGIDALYIYVPKMLHSFDIVTDQTKLITLLGSVISFAAVLLFTWIRNTNPKLNVTAFRFACSAIMVAQAAIGCVIMRQSVHDHILSKEDSILVIFFSVGFIVAYAALAGPKGLLKIPLDEGARATMNLLNWTTIWVPNIILKLTFSHLSCSVKGALLYVFFYITLGFTVCIVEQYYHLPLEI